jgi:hypothetical protein
MKKIALASALALMLNVSVSEAQDVNIQLVNNTPYRIVAFFASVVNVQSWEENMLHGTFLRPFSYINVNLYDGRNQCVYDLKAHFEDGDVVVKRNFNACALKFWRINVM